MFTEIQIYCPSGNGCCFDMIKNSHKPTVLINTDHIVALGPKETWGFCEGNEKYPYRRLTMITGASFLCVLESANKLEELLKGGGE